MASEQCRLLSLPTEIRLAIYDEVFQDVEERLVISLTRKSSRPTSPNNNARSTLLNLRSTCKQIRAETYPYTFGGGLHARLYSTSKPLRLATGRGSADARCMVSGHAALALEECVTNMGRHLELISHLEIVGPYATALCLLPVGMTIEPNEDDNWEERELSEGHARDALAFDRVCEKLRHITKIVASHKDHFMSIRFRNMFMHHGGDAQLRARFPKIERVELHVDNPRTATRWSVPERLRKHETDWDVLTTMRYLTGP